MELYVPASAAENLIKISKSFNIDARIIGRVEKNEGKKFLLTQMGFLVADLSCNAISIICAKTNLGCACIVRGTDLP